MTPQFLLAAVIVILIPGTGVLYTVANWIRRGSATAFSGLGARLVLSDD